MAGRNPNARSRDMLISMAVLLIPVVLIAWWFTQSADQKPAAVDVPGSLTRAEAESPFPVLRAGELGAGWTAVRVAWAKEGQPFITADPALGNSWQVGYLSPDEIYYAVLQRDAGASEFTRTMTRDGKALTGEVQAAGRTWQRYESPDERTRSLVNLDGEVVSIVAARARLRSARRPSRRP